MWRYLAGGVAALLMVAAGWLIVGGNAREGAPVLPPAPLSAAPPVQDAAAPLPDRAPEATPRSREQRRFDRYDKDRDGRITREEYLAQRRKAYAKLDNNGDGRLSFDEWAVATTTRFAGADRDRSNTMNAAEFATTAPKRSAAASRRCPPQRGDTEA